MPATMKWSSTFTSTSASASFRLRVSSSSAWLGWATPRGMVVGEDHRGGVVRAAPPSRFRADRRWSGSACRGTAPRRAITRFCASRQTQTKTSCGAAAEREPQVVAHRAGRGERVARLQAPRASARRASSIAAANCARFAAPRPLTSRELGPPRAARRRRRSARAARAPARPRSCRARRCAGRPRAARRRSAPAAPLRQQPLARPLGEPASPKSPWSGLSLRIPSP